VKAFLKLEAGITRFGASGPGDVPARQRGRRAKLSGGGGNAEAGGVNPENMVWIFGYGGGRSGTTWLSGMLGRLTGNTLWSSPRVGDLFGFFDYKFISDVSGADRERDEHILGHSRKDLWLKSMRLFILDQAAARYPKLTRDRAGRKRLIINDIHGSIGAPPIMEALPESRMILMMRDPRDVAASFLDARREGSWRYKGRKRLDKEANFIVSDPIAQLKGFVEGNLETMSNARQAYDNHKGHKTLLKYEDLRADALGAMKRAVAELGLTVDEAELARAVQRYSWENVPEEEKGQGKFYRKATPGGWREDLASEEIEIIEEAFAPLIEEFYAGDKKGRPADNMKSEGT
jgi:hypothetical protein